MLIKKIKYTICAVVVLAVLIPFFPYFTFAAAPVISNVTTYAITKSSLYVSWTTDVPASAAILYGLSSSYGMVSGSHAESGDTLSTSHYWYLSGLAPATAYHFCPQSRTSSGETSVCDGTANDFTVTTAAASSPAVLTPELPRITVDTTMPTQSGTIRNVSATDCNDPVTGLQAQLNAANYGDTVVIPAGMVCTGYYELPVKSSGNGWIVVRTSTPDNQLPPPGTRINPSYQPLMATLRANRIGPRVSTGTNRTGLCYYGVGTLHWNKAAAEGTLGLARCTSKSPETWVDVPYTSGASLPTVCSEGEWFAKTNTPAAQRIYRCLGGSWVNIDPNNAGTTQNVALYAPPGAHHYRLVGLAYTHVPAAAGDEQFYPDPPSECCNRPEGSFFWRLAGTTRDSHDIIFDRNYFYGNDFPSRLRGFMNLNGSNVGVVDSYMHKANVWNGAEATGINIQPGWNVKIQNNYIDAVGIGVFVPEVADVVPADIEVRGNYFRHDPKYLDGKPDSDGHIYANRHFLELKTGVRALIEGNIFDGNWADTAQGAIMALTPRPSSSRSLNETNTITDVTIRNNIFRNSAQGLLVAGHHNDYNEQVPVGRRYLLENNLFYNMDGFYWTSPSGSRPSGASGNVLSVIMGMEDLIVRHNTAYKLNGTSYAFLSYAGGSPNSGLIYKDNILDFVTTGAYGGISISGLYGFSGLKGTAGLNAAWTSSPNPFWEFNNNLIFGNISQKPLYPENNYWVSASSGVGFTDIAAANFSISPTSQYSSKASDGANPGVNWPVLQAATSRTETGGGSTIVIPPSDTTPPLLTAITATGITSSAATITWTSNEGSDTQVDYGTTTSYGSSSTLNASMVTNHSVSLGSLAPSTLYHFRVRSKDAAGNVALGADYTFTTTSSGPLPGDFNNDGIVNSLDYSLLSRKWNQTTNLTPYDMNTDGIINSIDYGLFVVNWGRKS